MKVRQGTFVFIHPEKDWGIVQETQDENHVLVCLAHAVSFFKEADLTSYFEVSNRMIEIGVSGEDVLDTLAKRQMDILTVQARMISDLQQEVSDLQKRVANLELPGPNEAYA